MDLRQLRFLVAVVDHGGFTSAAAASHISQPGLSKAIAELERDVGALLFNRVGRAVRLTAAGDALLPHARQALADADAGRAAVAAVAGLAGGRITMGCLPTLVADPVAALVGAFRRAHPAVRVELVDPDDDEDLLSMVRGGEVELAVTERPRRREGLVAVDLGGQQLVVVYPPATKVPRGAVAVRALDGVPLVLTPPGTSSRRVLDEALRRAGVEVTVAVETEQREALVPLVLAGAGAAVLPTAVAESARRLGAVVRPLQPALSRRLALVHRATPLSPAAQALTDLALSLSTARSGGKSRP